MTLLETLRTHTQDLKDEYLLKTKIWAEAAHKRAEEIMTWKAADWCNYFDIPVRLEDGKKLFPKNFYNTTDSRTLATMRGKYGKIAKMALADYIAQQEKAAIEHYESSLVKLVARLNKKGIGETVGSDLEIMSGKVGVNFEVTIKTSIAVVRAWTIIASGAVQQPHYRYLVK